MTPQSLQQYLHGHIPLSRAMAVQVEEAAPARVVMTAPLGPNVNHRETAFGGSISALAMLAGWSVIRLRLGSLGQQCRLVVAENTVHYLHPALGALTATTAVIPDDEWRQFVRMIERKGRGRLSMHVEVSSEGTLAAQFDARFVAITNPER